MSERGCPAAVVNTAAAARQHLSQDDLDLIVDLADGLTEDAMADKYDLTASCVASRFKRMRRHAGVANGPQLVSWAYRRQVLVVSRD